PLLSAAADNSLAALALSRIDPGRDWADEAAGARADYDTFIQPVQVTGAVNMSEVIRHLAEALPDDAIVTNGAGNFAAWLHRFHRHRAFRTQLAPTSGAMGYGVPAAVAAALTCPDREVVCVAGDGDFLMTGQELATAVQHGAKALFIVVDNGVYGTIRMHQERDYPARQVATALRNPDFVAFAQAFGAPGFRVERTADFPAALAKARAAIRQSGGPALIHLVTDPEDIAPGRTLTQLRGG